MHKQNKNNDFIQQFIFFRVSLRYTCVSMDGQKALGFLQKYLNLCSKDEQRSYGFGMT